MLTHFTLCCDRVRPLIFIAFLMGILVDVSCGSPVRENLLPGHASQLRYDPIFQVTIPETGEYQLIILQDVITSLQDGDEVGVFDPAGIQNFGNCENQIGQLLVGSAFWPEDQLDITAIGSYDYCDFGGYQGAGWVEGHPVQIHIYRHPTGEYFVSEPVWAAGSGQFGDMLLVVSELILNPVNAGCTDPQACNYDPEAEADDGSCAYEFDCAGVCGGDAFLDDCAECVGGITGAEFNWAMDCAGVCFGEAYENECGCVGGDTGLEPDFCYGCTDPEALNYDPDAQFDDGSCEYPGPVLIEFGFVDLVDGYFQLLMVNEQAVYGFQIQMTNVELLSAQGGSAAENGFTVQTNPAGLIIGFSTAGDVIPPGDGNLTTVNFSQIINPAFPICIESALITGQEEYLDVEIGDCWENDFILGCTDPEACNYNPNADYDDDSCQYWDCNMECGGQAWIDDCGVCVDGSTGLEPNADMDCDGVCFGEAYENECGCVGGTTGLDPDYCLGCTDPNAVNYDPDATVDDGSCVVDPFFVVTIQETGEFQLIIFEESITSILPGDELGIFDLQGIQNSGDCSNQIGELLVGSGIWTGEQLEITAIGSFDYCDLGGYQGAGFVEGNPVVIHLYRHSTVEYFTTTATWSAGTGQFGDLFLAVSDLMLQPLSLGCTDPGACNYNPDAVVDDGSCAYFDCLGECGGTAFIDECGICSGGSSGHEPNSDMDCEGVCFGDAYFDDCGVCSGGTTGHESNSDMDDCGVCFGSNADMDCTGTCFGSAYIDDCGECVGGSSGMEENWAMDCSGTCYGEAYIDNCGDCVGGTTGMEACIQDCNDEWGGQAYIDDCGICAGGSTGFEPNSDMDCAGVCFGDAYVNECGCVSGSTGLEFDFCYGCTDPNALNYDPDAFISDGSCEYPPSCEEQQLNEDCAGNCFEDFYLLWGGDGLCDDGSYGLDFFCSGWNFDSGDCYGETLLYLEVTTEPGDGWFQISDGIFSGMIGQPLATQFGAPYLVGNGGPVPALTHPDVPDWDTFISISDYSDGILTISIINHEDIGGFQFQLVSSFESFSLAGGFGGLAQSAGMMVSTNASGLVLAFSLCGAGLDENELETCANEGGIADCDNNCFAPIALEFLGDGNCHDGDLGEEIGLLNFDCSKWGWDAGDCQIPEEYDCAGILSGEAFLDDCGECVGGTTGMEPGWALDCNLECHGEAIINECGCVGGSTGLELDFCYGCMDEAALNYDPQATIDDGSCWILNPPNWILATAGDPGIILNWETVTVPPEVMTPNPTVYYNLFRNNILLIDNLTDTTYHDATAPDGMHCYYIISAVLDTESACSNSSCALGIDPQGLVPDGFRLLPCHPNPFNARTTVRFEVPQITHVVLRVYDLKGSVVTELVRGEYAPGRYQMFWQADAQPSGIYFLQLQADNVVRTEKLLLIK